MTIPHSNLPQHVAIIMDGNGRWAQERSLSRSEGHKAGVRAAKAIVTECRKLGIKHLTLYTFSKENWGRPAEEIGLLFSLLVDFLHGELPAMQKQGIKLQIFGEIQDLPLPARKALQMAMQATANCQNMTVNLALNYGGRNEILRAVKALLEQNLPPEELTEARFRQELYSKDQPDPDLVIRTSHELRLSNYLLFQVAYAELYFTPTYWPDFNPEALHLALEEYAKRERRFGLV